MNLGKNLGDKFRSSLNEHKLLWSDLGNNLGTGLRSNLKDSHE